MAVAPTVLLKINRRWHEEYIARLTRRSTYDADDSNFNTVDEDVLQVAIDQAQYRVQLKVGNVAEDHPTVIELIPYYLGAPLDSLDMEMPKDMLGDMKRAPNVVGTGAVSKDNTTSNNRRRFDGDDYMDLENTQKSIRGRRSKF